MQSFPLTKYLFSGYIYALGMKTEQLIEQVKTGDRAALRKVYETYAPMMRSVCAGITKADGDTVSDLVQEAFIKAYYSLGQLRDTSKFGEWAAAITKNVSLKYLEKKHKMQTLPYPSLAEEELEAERDLRPDAMLGEKELLELIGQLPTGYGTVFRMAVIEGYSHQEIAERLGINPHSSSSQLARAKAMLRRLINQRSLTVLAILLASVPMGRYLLRKGRMEKRNKPVARVEPKKKSPQQKAETVRQEAIPPLSQHPIATTHRRYKPLYAPSWGIPQDSIAPTTQDSVTSGRMEIATNDSVVADTALISYPDLKPYTPYIAETEELIKRQNHKWQLLAAGSLGSALAQNAYKFFKPDKDASSDIDGPTPFIPDTISTWEDYHEYLQFKGHGNVTAADTMALIDIARHNSGQIVEREQHDKPITLGLSITKSLNDRWSVETGLQYSLLKSKFTLGESAYFVQRRQQVHYLGLPLRVSYKWLNRKNWVAYSSVGVVLNLPLYGKNTERYVTDETVAHQNSWHFTPSTQWSIGASVGLQYRFAPHWGLYLEPTFNWFVPNGSSIHTIWTEHPFTITIPFGLRFTW